MVTLVGAGGILTELISWRAVFLLSAPVVVEHEAERALLLKLVQLPSVLERVVDCVESWGAEAIITGVADLSAEVVSGLETERLLIRKDISEAIATAFQIADVQRHLL